jgi:hypothetical protein
MILMVDPIVLLFGKDIAQLIYQRPFNDRVTELNKEYHYLLYDYLAIGAIRMKERLGLNKLFNYRALDERYAICRWNDDGPTTHMRSLPRNYWSIKELY